MSYNGTVYCRHCGEKGHNKRTCPHYTKQLKEYALREINNGEGYEGYWGKIYNKRVKKTGLYADGTAMSKEAIKAATKSGKRRCKYCGAQGHNRRTCPTLKADQAAYVERQIEWRKKIKAWAEETGYGVGSLLKVDRWGECFAWLITEMQWNEIADNDSSRGVVIVQSCRNRGRDSHSLPQIPELNEHAWTRTELVGRVPRVTFPENFLTEDGVKAPMRRQFENAQSSNYYDNYYG